MKRIRYENGDLDYTDVKLLEALVNDARSSIADLARRVKLSPPSVSERIRRLEEAGVIEGYSARVSAKALGYSLAACLRIRPVPGQLQRVQEILEAIPEVTECDRTTGEDCFIARACARSVEDLERLIDRIIPYAMTNTVIIQSSPVAPRLPPLTPEPT